jgi:hypothetical protein
MLGRFPTAPDLTEVAVANKRFSPPLNTHLV